MKNYKKYLFFILVSVFVFSGNILINAQEISATHTRGKLWETIYNYGFIGDPGAWDYLQVTGIGFYPGFSGFSFPTDEEMANGFITDANFHNFRTGPWIMLKDASVPTPPAFNPENKDYVLYHSSLATGNLGVLQNIPPFQKTRNFVDAQDFNPLLPEEMNYISYQTSTGITVKQRSMSWSFPGYDDFIIYDYTFVNTGDFVIEQTNQIKNHQQTLNEVWFVFHSGIQVSTKGVINFHYDSDFLSSTAPAGSFGWHPGGGYTDYYAVENQGSDGKGLLYYSRDFNGGRTPKPWDQHGLKSNWQEILKVKPEYEVELQDPAAFGFTFLYSTPPSGSGRDPFEADPTHFNIYSDEMDKFNGKTVDFESFGSNAFSLQELYQFIKHDYTPANNGNLYCWYTSSFGPYTIAPGDSVRLIVAEVAGMMDINEVVKGDPNNLYPDSTIAEIRRNAQAARNAIQWGFGAKVNGVDIAADVPESPPAPECRAANASFGSEKAVISVQWDKRSENAKIIDASGSVFYDGTIDLSGYRIYRGQDKRGVWELVVDIPRAELNTYWNSEKELYEYFDEDLQFGFEYYYFVQAYNLHPNTWTSANGTIVENLPELASSDYNRTTLTGARPGPVSVKEKWDVFVAPNPYIEGDPNHSFGEPTPRKIEFRNLPEKATIKIFTLYGDVVKTIDHGPDSNGNLFGSASWDQRTDAGLLVAPGLYIYVVQSNTEETNGDKTSGKFMLIR